MQKYEYMLYTLLVPIGQVQEEITKMAQGGWRLVAVNSQNGVHYFERLLTPLALDGAGTSPEYGATSNCVECGKRIVFCGDGVWLHCEPQNHGHARPNGAIVNPPRQ